MVLHLHASGEAVQALTEVVHLVVLRREPAVKAQPGGAEVQRIHVKRGVHPAATPGLTAHVGRSGDITDIRRQGDLLARRHGEVGAAGRVAEIVAWLCAALQLGPAGHVVLHGARPAAHARLVARDMPRAEDVADLGLEIRKLDLQELPR